MSYDTWLTREPDTLRRYEVCERCRSEEGYFNCRPYPATLMLCRDCADEDAQDNAEPLALQDLEQIDDEIAECESRALAQHRAMAPQSPRS